MHLLFFATTWFFFTLLFIASTHSYAYFCSRPSIKAAKQQRYDSHSYAVWIIKLQNNNVIIHTATLFFL